MTLEELKLIKLVIDYALTGRQVPIADMQLVSYYVNRDIKLKEMDPRKEDKNDSGRVEQT